MANPVTNNPVTPKTAVGGEAGSRKIATGAPVNLKAGNRDAITSVNENLAKNPNHAPAARAQTVHEAANRGHDGPDAGPAHDAKANLAQLPERGRPAGEERGATRGNGHGNGGGKANGGGGGKTPPIIVMPHGDGGGKQNGTVRTPPIIVRQPVNLPGELPKRGGHEGDDRRAGNDNRGHDNGHIDGHIDVHIDGRGGGRGPNDGNGRTNNIVRQVVDTVLRQNDVYVSRNELDRVLSNGSREVRALVDSLTARVGAASVHDQAKVVHEIAKESARQLHETVSAVKEAVMKDGALTFRQLNPAERFHAATTLLVVHLPEKAAQQVLQHRPADVANGLLFARGFASATPPVEPRATAAAVTDVLPANVSLTQLRDVGRLVQALIADTSAAKSTINLDMAVQKFVRLLVANNELGVLLATIDLAAGHANGAGAIGRSLALAQIYEMIGRMIAAGEKSLTADDKAVAGRNIFLGDDDPAKDARPARTASEAAASLRQFLEFSPHCHFDRAASAFLDQNDARSAQRDFSSSHAQEIEAWLKSGNHRLVKELELGRDVGIVVERSGEVFPATTARFVLVRDGSAQGWHFLRTMLVT